MPDRNEMANGVASFARDAVYVVVGLGVLGYQRAQVQRVALEKRLGEDVPLDEWLGGVRTAVHHGAQRVGEDVPLDEWLGDVRTAVQLGAQRLDDAVEHAVALVESAVQPLEDQLPGPARDLAGRAHAGAREVRRHLRELVGTATGSPGGTGEG